MDNIEIPASEFLKRMKPKRVDVYVWVQLHSDLLSGCRWVMVDKEDIRRKIKDYAVIEMMNDPSEDLFILKIRN